MRTPRTAVGMTVTMCVAEAFSMSGFAAYTTLLPQFQREWSLSNSEARLIGGDCRFRRATSAAGVPSRTKRHWHSIPAGSFVKNVLKVVRHCRSGGSRLIASTTSGSTSIPEA